MSYQLLISKIFQVGEENSEDHYSPTRKLVYIDILLKIFWYNNY